MLARAASTVCTSGGYTIGQACVSGAATKWAPSGLADFTTTNNTQGSYGFFYVGLSWWS